MRLSRRSKGCLWEVNTIECGLQTVDERINNDTLNRRFHRKRYFENFLKLHEKGKDRISVSVIYGLPRDTYEGFRKTMDTVLSELGAEHFIGYRFNVLPGTYFRDHAEEYGLVFEKDPPHRILSSNTFSEEEIRKSGRLVFYLYLFTTIFRGVMRVVKKNVEKHQLDVYERIIEHIAELYPEFLSGLYDHFEKDEDFEFVLRMDEYLKDRKYVDQRYDIIRAAREIVLNYNNNNNDLK